VEKESKMIDKEELLEQLQKYGSFVVYKLVNLTTEERRGIDQTTCYHNVKLDWNGSVFKFWDGKENETFNKMLINSSIDSYEIEPHPMGDKIVVHIENCLETVEIICNKRHPI
jgi:hypothetical protein